MSADNEGGDRPATPPMVAASSSNDLVGAAPSRQPTKSGAGHAIADAFADVFERHGRMVARGGATAVLLFTLALLIAFSIVLINVEKETDIETLWVKQGSRLIDERAAFRARWGGLTRKQLVMIDSKDGGGYTTKAHLDSLVDVLRPIMTKEENGIPNPIQLTLSSRIGLNSSVASYTYGETDFCEAPPVPPLFATGPKALVSFGYSVLANCIVTAVDGNTNRNLPAGWGIDRFPCVRVTALDCFREGNFDYPRALQQLDAVVDTVFTQKAGNTATYVTCAATLNATLNAALIAGGLSAAAASATANQIFPVVTSTFVPLAWTWGYRWRKSYSSMSDVEIKDHIQAGANNAGLSITACIAGGGLPCCHFWSGTKVAPGIWNSVTTDLATRTVINNYNENHPSWRSYMEKKYPGLSLASADDRLNLMLQWEEILKEYLLRLWNSEPGTGYGPFEAHTNTQVKFLLWRSYSDTVDEGTQVEVGLVIGGYAMLVAYTAYAFARITVPYELANSVYSRVGLSFVCLGSIALATISSFGFMAMVGVKISAISSNLVPFLALGTGVNDAYVLVGTLRKTATEFKTPEGRLAGTLGIAGPSMVLTSVTNAAAYFIASSVPIPAVRTFVLQMGVVTILMHIALMGIFVPFAYWDLQRSDAGRSDCCTPPCVLIGHGERVRPEHDPDLAFHEEISDKIAKNILSPLQRNVAFKVFTLLAFGGACGFLAWYGLTQYHSGLRLADVALRGTYVRDGSVLNENEFATYDAFAVVTSDIEANLSSSTSLARNQEAQTAALVALQSALDVASVPQVRDLNYLGNSSSSLLAFAQVAFALPSQPTNISVGLFGTIFQKWVTTNGATQTPNLHCVDVSVEGRPRVDCSLFDPAKHVLEGAKTTFFTNNMVAHDEVVSSIKDIRSKLDSVQGSDTFSFGYLNQYWEQYLDIADDTLATLGWALLGVFLATLALQFSPLSSLLCVIVIVMVVLELWGVAVLIDIKLNAFSIVNLVIILAMAVEFSAHIMHKFILVTGTRQERADKALLDLNGAMFDGAASTVLALLPLIGAQFPFFRQYYCGMLALGIVIAYLNGVLLVPVILSLVGPAAHVHDPSFKEEASETTEMVSSTSAAPLAPADTV